MATLPRLVKCDFDTDVFAIRNISPLLNNEAFVGYEAPDYPFTAVFGAKKGHPLIKDMLDYYDLSKGRNKKSKKKNRPQEERTKQMHKICRDAERYAKIIPALIDIRGLRNPDGSEDWEAETPLVRKLLGDKLDAVYSSEESYGDYFSRAYPEAVHRLVDVKRIHYPISGTEIREMNREEERAEWIIQ